MTEYRNYLEHIKGLSTATVDGYCNDLYSFSQWAAVNIPNATWELITRSDIDRYETELSLSGLSASTINRRLSALSAYYRFKQRQGEVTANPVQYATRHKRTKRVPSTIDTHELNEAYRHASGEGRLILGLLCTTGIRLSELLNIKVGNIDTKRGFIFVLGKGRQERVVYPKPCVMNELAAHITDMNEPEKLFDYTPRGMRSLVHALLKPYCTAKQLSPHAIRHTYATHLALKGTPTSEIAALLGHNDLGSAQYYIDYAQHIKAGERSRQ